MTKLELPCILGAVGMALLGVAPFSQAQPIADLYRITDSVSHNRMEYHQLGVAGTWPTRSVSDSR
jgi:hypothetical protein